MGIHRKERLETVLREEISKILSRDFDSVGALVTITEVVTTAKGENAEVGISVIPSDKAQNMMNRLRSKQGDVQRQLIKKLNMHYVPHIEFVLDTGLENSARIERLLKDN